MLTMNGINKGFVAHQQPALIDIDLEVNPAEFMVLLGSSGSGKSTLLKLINRSTWYPPE